jgi:hypothetical protein
MARPKGGQKIMAMAKAGAAKRAVRKRAYEAKLNQLEFRAKDLGGERWERSWERTRAKSRKLMDKLHKDVAESEAKSKKWEAKGAAMLRRAESQRSRNGAPKTFRDRMNGRRKPPSN